MPAGDKTGPLGLGPMTGRGMGYCGGSAAPGYVAPIGGRQWGGGRGAGRGAGRGGGRGGEIRNGGRYGRGRHAACHPDQALGTWIPADGVSPRDPPPDAEHEMRVLSARAERLEGMLSGLRRRIARLTRAYGEEE